MNKPGVGNARSTVPVPTHGFIGRRDELELISSLLTSGPHRMITLIGPGGIGKTTLAAEAVRRVRASDVQVHWVPLARLPVDSEFAAVERETARLVISTDFSQRNTFDALVDTLNETDSTGPSQRVVLVFDNGEHVLGGLQHLITDLLSAVPDLTILATSRSPIAWVDERLISVPQLPAAEGLELFRQRAQLTGRPLTGRDKAETEANEEAAVNICKHVHYNPLYIRLAAARLRYQAAPDLSEELTGRPGDKRLEWSSGTLAGADERQLTVTNVIAWSLNLCSPKQRILFNRMSVFAATGDTTPDDIDTADVGASLEAIQAVCSDDEQASGDDEQVTLSRHEIGDLLEHLVDQSLVTIHITRSGQRYSLMESLRVYAWDRLRDCGSGEPTRLASRHLAYYRDRVVDAAGRWFSPDEQAVVDWARTAWPNIISAIENSVTIPGEARRGLEICRGLMTSLRTPFVKGSLREILGHTDKCLAASETLTPQPTDLQIAALSAMAWLAVRQGDSAAATKLLEQVATVCLSDPDNTDWRNNPDIDFGLPPIFELAWGTEMFMSGRDPRAIVVLERARQKFHDNGDPAEIFAGMFGAFAAAHLGSAPQAHEIARRAVDQAEPSGANWALSWVKLGWAVTLIKHGDPHEGAKVLRGTLSHQLSVRDRWGAMWSVLMRAWALECMITGDGSDRDRQLAIEIAHLVGGSRTVQERLGVDIDSMGTFADATHKATEAAREVLGPATFIAEMARGARLSPHKNEVHRLALGELILTVDPMFGKAADQPGRPAANTVSQNDPWDRLSRTEKEVARQVAAGQSNTEIAHGRRTSRRTVDRQVSAILNKFGLTSRKHVAQYIPEEPGR